ncbi:hypothetical protein N7478_009310 [Penicillium angulare]|uniref:uncharacterized protein n=1 Tax=Penicillium angulare TaxID=116970 RepID=UPI00253F8CC1|nr:uncharacterized protein N7478_009310 [Penicillium angulare]KAJ5266502.1 hypothetical protein N7478_009310 [Penicillium angulare]
MSSCDGGQLLFNVLLGGQEGRQSKKVLFNGHLDACEGIVNEIQPKPDIAVLGIAERANLNGRPFDGSAATFATKLVKWIREPQKVIWCLRDEWEVCFKSTMSSNRTGLIQEPRQKLWRQRRAHELWICLMNTGKPNR